MAALWNRAGHYIFILLFLSIFFYLFPRLISAAAHWMSIPYFDTWCDPSANLECRSEMCWKRLAGNTGPKKSPSGHHRTTLSGHIFATKARIEKKLLSSNTASTCFHNMVNFGPLAAEIDSVVWGTPANFNGFRVLAALLHGKLRGVEQRAPPIFGRAAITLDIGPHSSFSLVITVTKCPTTVTSRLAIESN